MFCSGPSPIAKLNYVDNTVNIIFTTNFKLENYFTMLFQKHGG